MGSIPSLPWLQTRQNRQTPFLQAQYPAEHLQQAQCPADNAHQAQNIVRPGRQERILTRGHKIKGHHLVTNIELTIVKEYQTELSYIKHIAVSPDDSLWIGQGWREESFHPFTKSTALQKVKLVDNKLKVISSFNMWVYDIAVSSSGDLLLATMEPRLKQIKAGSSKVTDSLYCVISSKLRSVHVMKNGRVIVGGYRAIDILDKNGLHLKRHELDKNGQPLFNGNIISLTSTNFGNIFMVEGYPTLKVVMFIGSSRFYTEASGLSPRSVQTTPSDNVIVADRYNSTLHILDNTGIILTIYNTHSEGLSFPCSPALTTEGIFSDSVLYLGCYEEKTGSDKAKLYKMNITGC